MPYIVGGTLLVAVVLCIKLSLNVRIRSREIGKQAALREHLPSIAVGIAWLLLVPLVLSNQVDLLTVLTIALCALLLSATAKIVSQNRSGGETVIEIGRSRLQDCCIAFSVFILLCEALRPLVPTASTVGLAELLFSVVAVPCFFVIGRVKPRVCQRGIASFYGLIIWAEIAEYKWQAQPSVLVLRLRDRMQFGGRVAQVEVPPDARNLVDGLLERHVLNSGHSEPPKV